MIRLENGKHGITIEVTANGDLLESRFPLSQPGRKKTATLPKATFTGRIPEERADQLVQRFTAQGYTLVEEDLRPAWMLRVTADDPQAMRHRLARILELAGEVWDGVDVLPGTFVRLAPRSHQLRLLGKLPWPVQEAPYDRSFDLPLMIAACLGLNTELIAPDGTPDTIDFRVKERSPRWPETFTEPLYAFGVLKRPFVLSRSFANATARKAHF